MPLQITYYQNWAISLISRAKCVMAPECNRFSSVKKHQCDNGVVMHLMCRIVL